VRILSVACREGCLRETPEVTETDQRADLAKDIMRIFNLALLSPLLLTGALAQTTTAAPAPTATLGLTISHAGVRPVVDGSTKFFTGSAKVEQLFPVNAPSRVSGGIVTFAPGARSAWHTHPLGQVLIITAGTGRVQMEGGPIQVVHAGDVVIIPAHVKHWHGAAPDSSMSHIAIQDNLDGDAVDWLEPVTDQQYNGGK
jgi:quercetin dioxygenase-like cupin family protein